MSRLDYPSSIKSLNCASDDRVLILARSAFFFQSKSKPDLNWLILTIAINRKILLPIQTRFELVHFDDRY